MRLLIVLVLLMVAPARADLSLSPGPQEYVSATLRLMVERSPDNFLSLVEAFSKAPKDSLMVRQIARQALVDRSGDAGDTDLTSLMILSSMQNQRIIEQNEKIIGLLERIAAKK